MMKKTYTIYPKVKLGKDVFIGDYASVRTNSIVGDNTIIGSYVRIENNVIIGKNCMIGTGAVVGSGTIIHDNVFIGPNCILTNDKEMVWATDEYKSYTPQGPIIYNNVKIGAGVIVLAGISISKDVKIGAGSIITKDISEPGTYIADYGKILRIS